MFWEATPVEQPTRSLMYLNKFGWYEESLFGWIYLNKINTHKIHGIGTFTHMNGWFLLEHVDISTIHESYGIVLPTSTFQRFLAWLKNGCPFDR